MDNIIQKIRQLDKKTKITAVAVAGVIVLVAVFAGLFVDNYQKGEIISTIKDQSPQFETRGDTEQDLLLKYLDYEDASAEGFDLRNFDIEVVARKDDWVAIRAVSLQLSNYGNQVYVIYQKEGDEYVLKLSGSIISQDDYEELSVPSEIVNGIGRAMARGNDSHLRTILGSAPSKTYPIINSLPIGNNFYKITYHFSDQSDINSFYLYVDAEYGYNNAAIFNLINAGFDPGDYKIVFNYDIVMGKVGSEDEAQ
jgi:hypothetical protein